MLPYGLYEQIINELIQSALNGAQDSHAVTERLDEAEAAQVLSQYAEWAIRQALTELGETVGPGAQVDLVNRIMGMLTEDPHLAVISPAQMLLSLKSRMNTLQPAYPRPETSLARSCLFTGAMDEPSLYAEMKKEILSCDRIDMLVSFIKWSGLRMILEDLRSFTQGGGQLRVITTSYMGATDIKSVAELHALPNAQIRISYDTARTRLHAKTYVFYRNSGFSTAYVGSSNLTCPAISSGLEWNVKLTKQDQPETFRKIGATFDSYWNAPEFDPYDASQEMRLARALKAERMGKSYAGAPGYSFEIRPYPYQQEILDALEAERRIRGMYRNLIVAATGTGKTVISALDYKRFAKAHPGDPCRLLFVAHREEILKQSLDCFRGVLKDQNFGDLFVGGHRPEGLDHLFVSIQMFHAQDLTSRTTPDFYDYIVVDEFHHAAAPTYDKLLSYYRPRILLGLTATPERMDGKDVLGWFGGRIAAEIRLPEAIERKLLSPFQYFGVTDPVNLEHVRWTRGGYDREELSNLYTVNRAAAERRADMVIQSIRRYVADLEEVRGLGFCVSVRHAAFMTNWFERAGIPARCVTGETPSEEREAARNALKAGTVRFIFTVDVYNEGVDIPEVNTILFLRPTESLTIFLQQLGRGLRLADGKECLTVLDFIGQANQRYDFAGKLKALLGKTQRGIRQEILNGFQSVPKGCYIQLEKKAQAYILENIRSALTGRRGLIDRIRTFEADTGLAPTLGHFCGFYSISPKEIYKTASFARLCVLSGVRPDFQEAMEETMTKALLRMARVDSRRLIRFLLDVLARAEIISDAALTPEELRMLAMFQFTVWQKSYAACGFGQATDALRAVKKSPVLAAELAELLRLRFDRIDFLDESAGLDFACPLDVPCTYSRDQALVALDFLNPATVREGVKYLPEKHLDVFFVTLNKSDKEYSPSTMYNDYAISDTLFHWQSQSTTSEESPTGQRYIHHREQGGRILLFVRENKKDAYGSAPYTFLGEAEYVSHTGSRPMNITLRLKKPIPAKYLRTANRLIV
ncbi:DUF3427 domain-containing protein [Bacillota bacterium Meth-B3]